MRALFAVRGDGADAWFRAAGPASVLRYQGFDVEARRFYLEDAERFDVLILQRHADPGAEIIMHEFQRRGKKVIYDCDDWLAGLPPSWGCYEDYYHRGRATPRLPLTFHERLLRGADLVTCPTWPLANKLREYTDKIRVIPNALLWAHWDIVQPTVLEGVEGPVVGWFGLPYHWDSWKQIVSHVERAVREVGGYLVILGFPEVVHCFSDWLKAHTLTQAMVPWKRFDQFRAAITAFDVGLCWLEDTPFNRCKSPLRALQYGAAGVPIVASECVYGDVLADKCPGQYGLVVDTPDGVYYAIKNALEHREPARLRAEAWRLQVWKEHALETQAWRWARTIEELAK